MSSETFSVSPEELADAVVERLADGFFKLPADLVNELKPYAGQRTTCVITSSMTSVKIEIIIQDAGGFSRDVKTYTIASRFGNGATPDDREVVLRADETLGWSRNENTGRVFHFARLEDASSVMRELGPHRDGAHVHVMEW